MQRQLTLSRYWSYAAIFILCCGCSPTRKSPTSDLGADAKPDRSIVRMYRQDNPRRFGFDYGTLTLWWDNLPAQLKQVAISTGETTNIKPEAYVGPESCERCHQENYQAWSEHPHRWMNVLANQSTVVGDFSGKQHIDYLGGKGYFYRDGDDYRMRLERDDLVREYDITQTIGSRFFQYYVGKMLEGPEPPDHAYYHQDHVLPFGYWLDYEQWVPIVHVSEEITCDSQSNDPYLAKKSTKYTICNSCHTTFALGDRLVRDLDVIGRGSPYKLHLNMARYLQASRPELIASNQHPSDVEDPELDQLIETMVNYEAPKQAVTLGISCEACHLGLKTHVEGKQKKPDFFPHDENLWVAAEHESQFFHKSKSNLNWSCSRCHVGPRPQLAAGMATWNSTEASDAFKGSCYSQLTCTDCHSPHQAIGKQWTKTPEQDDASCLKCHQELNSDQSIVEHTHHPVGSAGARCMNCHMPRMNEGLQDVVRTHMIFSPTNPQMIHANQPNACNMCHTDKSINWTIGHLEEWYGSEFDQHKLVRAYQDTDESAALGWLKSENEAVRLIAADALIRDENRHALPDLLNALDDHYLLNRQFAYRQLEMWLGVDLEQYGYKFYMTPEERVQPLEKIKSELLDSSGR